MAIEEPVTVASAEHAVSRLRRGESFCYHRGYLPFDREKYGEDAERIDAVAAYMLSLGCPETFVFGDGCVAEGLDMGFLFQRKVAKHRYEYIFVKK